MLTQLVIELQEDNERENTLVAQVRNYPAWTFDMARKQYQILAWSAVARFTFDLIFVSQGDSQLIPMNMFTLHSDYNNTTWCTLNMQTVESAS